MSAWGGLGIAVGIIESVCIALDILLLRREKSRLYDLLLRAWVWVDDRRVREFHQALASGIVGGVARLLGRRRTAITSIALVASISFLLTYIAVQAGQSLDQNAAPGLLHSFVDIHSWWVLLMVNLGFDGATVAASFWIWRRVARASWLNAVMLLTLDLVIAVALAAGCFWSSQRLDLLWGSYEPTEELVALVNESAAVASLVENSIETRIRSKYKDWYGIDMTGYSLEIDQFASDGLQISVLPHPQPAGVSVHYGLSRVVSAEELGIENWEQYRAGLFTLARTQLAYSATSLIPTAFLIFVLSLAANAKALLAAGRRVALVLFERVLDVDDPKQLMALTLSGTLLCGIASIIVAIHSLVVVLLQRAQA